MSGSVAHPCGTRRLLRAAGLTLAALGLGLGGAANPARATPDVFEPGYQPPPRPGKELPPPIGEETVTPQSVVREIPEQADGTSMVGAPGDRRIQSVEEMTITARKREELLQETPISVTAFSDLDLRSADLRRADDLSRFTPNLKFDQAAGESNGARLTIRGVGTNDPINTRDPGVGVYLDGVYLARAQGQLLGISDIDRIEVLRGPQGTLFGRNTIGGAVHVITKKPVDALEAAGELRVGNFNLVESRGSLNVPLIPERAAARLSFLTVTRDGYGKNTQNGQEVDDRRFTGGRLAFVFNATDDMEILLSGEQTRSHTAGRAGECRFQPGALPTDGRPNIVNAEDTFGFEFRKACRASQADDAFEFQSPVRSSDDVDNTALGSTITWDFASFTFKSISSWRRQDTASRSDFTFASIPIGTRSIRPSEHNQLSQEFNWNGAGLDGQLAWTAGLYALYEKTDPGRQDVFVGFNLCQQSDDFCAASFMQTDRIQTNALAAYGQFTYDVTPTLHWTAGLRRSVERKRYTVSSVNFATATKLDEANRFRDSQTARFGKWTPLVNVTYDMNPGMIVYATYSRGFKSGGFNGRPTPGLSFTLEPFKQEVLDNYEVGLKSSWFDNRVVANVSLFRGNYRDIQTTILTQNKANGAFASRVANAAQAVVQGAEVELRAVPTPGLDLRVGLGFTDAEYDTFRDVGDRIENGQIVGKPVDRSDEDFANTPDFTATISAAYTFYDVMRLGDLTARVSWFHSSPVNYAPDSDFDTVLQNTYGVLSGKLGFALADGKTEVALWGENLLNRRYLNSGIGFEDGFGLSLGYYAPPRMYGVEIRRQF